jgi:hypothetical protein
MFSADYADLRRSNCSYLRKPACREAGLRDQQKKELRI